MLESAVRALLCPPGVPCIVTPPPIQSILTVADTGQKIV